MTSQPEKLFRDKLENFQQAAPVSAWEKIESNLDQKRRTGVWLKAAATLVILITAGFILWPALEKDNTQPITQSKPEALVVIPKEDSKIAPSVAQVVEPKSSSKKNKIKSTAKKETEIYPSESLVLEQPVIEIKVESTVVVVNESNEAQTIPSKTIVYTAEEVNAKFLKKKKSAEATSEEKKSSGIQKLMGLAADLKNTENGIGDLRQKKDEILALNFLKEDKTNNEKN